MAFLQGLAHVALWLGLLALVTVLLGAVAGLIDSLLGDWYYH